MLSSLKQFFEVNFLESANDAIDSPINKLDLACAALLIEVMNSDNKLDARESREFIAVLKNSLSVSDQNIEAIVALAKSEVKQATSLYEFTRLINDNFDYSQKLELVENMWRIAFSDDQLDKYEDNLIRKVAELIYVTHSDFIRTKLQVRNRSE